MIPQSDIQILHQFMDFLQEEFDLSEDDAEKAVEVRAVLDDLESNKDQDMTVSIDIFDHDIQTQQSDRSGVYWRDWSIFLEAGTLEVRARSSREPERLPCDHFELAYCYDFKRGTLETNGKLEDWLADAKTYKQYITEHLNDVNVDIDL